MSQNPNKILSSFVSEGMTVVDYGCGNGYFTVPLAKMVGNSGKVIAVDIQQEMLDKVSLRLKNNNLKNVELFNNSNSKLNYPNSIDFAIAIYVVHEIPNKKAFFKELYDNLKLNSKLLIMEPNFIVSRKSFTNTINLAKEEGFKEVKRKRYLFSRSVILKK
jgi:ubiquinone/menaquinone biosynthesis C-methylase UbiE